MDADQHQHHAIQLVWPALSAKTEVNEVIVEGPVMINTDIEHRMTMEKGWIILLEPQTRIGDQLTHYLDKQPYKAIRGLPNFPEKNLPVLTPGTAPPNERLPVAVLQPLFNWLHIPLLNDRLLQASMDHLDSRILNLKNALDICFEGECQKPEKWRAAEVAADLALSEGRFLHLFKQEMGIAWRPYLLWRRLLCAVRLLQKGRSATDAAYVAGFSDSAHLSRTFRKMFGLSVREALNLF